MEKNEIFDNNLTGEGLELMKPTNQEETNSMKLCYAYPFLLAGDNPKYEVSIPSTKFQEANA